MKAPGQSGAFVIDPSPESANLTQMQSIATWRYPYIVSASGRLPALVPRAAGEGEVSNGMDGDFRTHFVRDPAALKQFPALVLNADYRPLSYYPLSLWPWQEAIKAAVLDLSLIHI